jgi:DNA helicase HerA-like ATPase
MEQTPLINPSLQLSSLKIDNITQRRAGIIGGPGTGKTTTLKIIALAFPPHIKLYIFDPLNVIPEMPGFEKIRIKKTDIDKGGEFGKFLNKINLGKKKGIIFSFIKLLQSEQSIFTDELFKVWNPKDCVIAFDEIHEFTPERGMEMKYGSETERAIRHWRNQNVGFIFTSQRPAFVSKKVLGLADFLILFRITWTADVKVIKELLQQMNQPMADKIVKEIQTKPFLNGYSIDFRLNETV